MAARGEHRIKKLESSLLGNLTPKERVRMVLTAAADGDTDQARRIGQACPRRTYCMADADYLDRLEDGHSLCKCAIAHFRQYVFAQRQIEGVKGFLCAKVTDMIASHASTLSVSAMLKDGQGDGVDSAHVDAAEEEAREFAAKVTARMLDAMQGELRRHVQAEWAGFDAVCREEIGLEVWTLFRGYEVPKELIAELQGLLSAEGDGGSQETDKAAVAEGLAFWRAVIQGWREGQDALAAGRDGQN